MSTGLGDTVVNLKSDATKFNKGIDSAKFSMKDFGTSAVSFMNPVTAGLATMAAGAAAAAGILYGVANRIATIAGIVDKASQTGLSGAFLQRLAFAADQSGVSVETLQAAMKKLTIQMGNTGSTMTAEERFKQIAEEISKIPTQAGRAAAAVKYFGKSGVEMTTLLSEGMGGLNELLAEAKRLGIGLDDESLAKVARADDAIQKMKSAFGALIDQVAVGLAPAFEDVSNAITEMIVPLTKFFDKFNAMEGKWEFVADVIVAAFDVATESIKLKWNEMFDELIAVAMKNALLLSNPAAYVGGKIGAAIGGAAAKVDPNEGVNGANQRLQALIDKFNAAPDARDERIANDKAKEPANGSALSDLASGLLKSGQERFGRLAYAAELEFNIAKTKAGLIGQTFKNMFSGEKIKDKDVGTKTKQETNFAGAMVKGSQEAYSTILTAMMASRDPNVIATKQQTKEIVKELKNNKPPKFAKVEAFA